jgi:hypothetical protein
MTFISSAIDAMLFHLNTTVHPGEKNVGKIPGEQHFFPRMFAHLSCSANSIQAMNPTNLPTDKSSDIETLKKQIEELQEREEKLKKQLEERQELMQNLFSFVESNMKKL